MKFFLGCIIIAMYAVSAQASSSCGGSLEVGFDGDSKCRSECSANRRLKNNNSLANRVILFFLLLLLQNLAFWTSSLFPFVLMPLSFISKPVAMTTLPTSRPSASLKKPWWWPSVTFLECQKKTSNVKAMSTFMDPKQGMAMAMAMAEHCWRKKIWKAIMAATTRRMVSSSKDKKSGNSSRALELVGHVLLGGAV